ncbi:MAG: hypothetical protein FGO69_08765 [Methanobacterium sp.]|nr:MAG: hypothetical protein FGO69_08765 [Methanobacterium sp.]
MVNGNGDVFLGSNTQALVNCFMVARDNGHLNEVCIRRLNETIDAVERGFETGSNGVTAEQYLFYLRYLQEENFDNLDEVIRNFERDFGINLD